MQRNNRFDLREMARQAMLDRELIPDFSDEIKDEVRKIGGPADVTTEGVRDMRKLLWFSIDNDDSRDLDQLSYAERLEGDTVRLYVAVADVDVLVPLDSPTDERARHNTTSVYTAGGMFPMLPEELSTDWTSLNEGVDRLALVYQFDVAADGTIGASEIYRAAVHNHAKLAYDNVAAWIDGEEELPAKLGDMGPLQEQLRIQNEAADRLRDRRHEHGALILETIEPRAVTADGKVVDLVVWKKNEARELIEDLMIASNGVVARYLEQKGYPVFRRVVREPERWLRIVDLAKEYGGDLPPTPDSAALLQFLRQEKKRDPLRFPDLSLSVVKLIGKGEYVIDPPGEEPPGHFGLAVRDYSHSTAPNRRYPDLITHRILKAALEKKPAPYDLAELEALAEHCTNREDDANKVERIMRKAAAATMLMNRVGEHFDALVTGASSKGTWVRILHPPVEGKLVKGDDGVDVGDKIKVKLVGADPERGFIDFVRSKR